MPAKAPRFDIEHKESRYMIASTLIAGEFRHALVDHNEFLPTPRAANSPACRWFSTYRLTNGTEVLKCDMSVELMELFGDDAVNTCVPIIRWVRKINE